MKIYTQLESKGIRLEAEIRGARLEDYSKLQNIDENDKSFLRRWLQDVLSETIIILTRETPNELDRKGS